MNNLYWYAIERAEVEKKDFRGIEQLLKAVGKIGKEANASVGLSFSGYGDDPREIYELETIRSWVKILLFRYPQILYYTENGMNKSLQNILLCYGDIETFYLGEKKALNEYSMEEQLTGLPEITIRLTINKDKLETLYKAIRKEGVKQKDLEGANKVIQEIENILS